MAQGREDASTHWCLYSPLICSLWKAPDHEKGGLLSIVYLQKRYAIVQDGSAKTPRDVKEVSQLPIFQLFLPNHFIPSILHLEISLVNM